MHKLAIIVYWLSYAVGYLQVVLKWHPWSPWSVAKLNIAWKHYTKTVLYEERVKLNHLFGNDQPDFATKSFVDNKDYRFFLKQVTKKEWLKIIFCPFSCGDKFQMPFWRIKEWIGI